MNDALGLTMLGGCWQPCCSHNVAMLLCGALCLPVSLLALSSTAAAAAGLTPMCVLLPMHLCVVTVYLAATYTRTPALCHPKGSCWCPRTTATSVKHALSTCASGRSCSCIATATQRVQQLRGCCMLGTGATTCVQHRAWGRRMLCL
jgi:hypothetical protein